MSTVALYARVSSDKQVDNFSIEHQLETMRDWAIAEGYDYIELPEVGSAFKEGLSRTKLQQGLDLARRKQIDAFVFFSPDRFTRDIADGAILRRELRKLGVKLICFYPRPTEVNEDMEILHILTDWQSQQYVQKLAERSGQIVHHKALSGLYSQGNVVYGYKLVGKKHDTRVEVVPEEASVIRAIYEMYLQDEMPMFAIADELNTNPKYPPARRGKWTPSSIRNALRAETYTGVWYAFRFYQVTENGRKKWRTRPKEECIPVPMPVIIDPQIFADTQKRLRSRITGRPTYNQYLMSGRLTCGRCGHAAIGQKEHNGKKDYFYYRCNSIGRRKPCGMRKFPVRQVDETVWQFAYEFIQDPQRVLIGLQRMQKEDAVRYDGLVSQIETITARIEEAQSELSMLIDQRTKAKATSLQLMLDEKAEQIAGTIDELKVRLTLLWEAKGAAPFSDERIAEVVSEIEELKKVFAALEHINQTGDFAAKRAIIVRLNLKATLREEDDGERWVDIHWYRQTYQRKLWVQNKIEGAVYNNLNTSVYTFPRRLLRAA